jgi:hypothetical protein
MSTSDTTSRHRSLRHMSSPSLLPRRGATSAATCSLDGLADDAETAVADQDRLARLLHPSAPLQRLSETELLRLVAEICDQVAIERPMPGAADGRRYMRLLRNETVEAWIIAWASSSYVGLHDHGDSRGAYQVVTGRLREVSTDLVGRDPLTTLRLRPGMRRSLSPLHVHELWNPTRETALSVHVYSPPLRTMNFYSDEPSTYLAKLRTETEIEWPDPDRWAERAVG